jgi:hypothetical protein
MTPTLTCLIRLPTGRTVELDRQLVQADVGISNTEGEL